MGLGRALRKLHLGLLLVCAAAMLTAASPGPIPAAPTDGPEQVLYSFCQQTGCGDGSSPFAGLLLDSTGNLYGTTVLGGNGSNAGTVFQLTPNSSGGWTETVLYAFCPAGQCADGAEPRGGLVVDSAGNLYGTASKAGNKGKGVVFELSPTSSGWSYQVLYRFCPELTGCSHGADPEAGLVIDAAGNLYGTTYVGGSSGYGVVFELSPGDAGWTYQVLYDFCSQDACADGRNPQSGLIIDGTGKLYGTTIAGGSNDYGAVFELTPSGTGWSQTVLYSFCAQTGCADGADPSSGVIMDGAGNLYGTTETGGKNGNGVVFELISTDGGWNYRRLYAFCQQIACPDGQYPNGGVIMDAAGNLYGTTTYGGGYCPNTGTCGIAYRLSPVDAVWQQTTLYSFCSQSGCADGAYPFAGLILGGAGNLYGTTYNGGTAGLGTVFAISAANSLTVSETGKGTVTSSPGGIDCPTTCSANFAPGTPVTLTAAPASSWTFKGWGGACSGTGTCMVTMNTPQNVSATFSTTYTLSVSVVGASGGKVTSSPAGINCGSTCSASFNSGTPVTLAARAAR
jgi:uncharacterized repeat protein (TIGR03803 family)